MSSHWWREAVLTSDWSRDTILTSDWSITSSGVYHCIAENSQGKVHARAVVGVYRKEL